MPPGAKDYWGNDATWGIMVYWGNDAARGIMVYRYVTPPGSGHKNEPMPEGSHVYKMLPPGAKGYDPS